MKQNSPNFFLQTSKSTIAKARALRKVMTPEEKKLWSHLRNKSFGVQFRKQVPFGPYILDFFCLAKKLAIELDGDQHYTEEGKEYDAARDEYLRSHEITVLRFRNRELKTNLDGVLTMIWEVCKK
jgi:very-short-patch-repair endonuclease